MPLDTNDFSATSYQNMLRELKQRGYRFVNFENSVRRDGTAIVRHDVDFSLEYAKKMAFMDSSAGIGATFFVLVSTEFYNIFSRAGRACLRDILGQGHEIGLHFDQSIYDVDGSAMEDAARRECAILEDVLGRPVRVTAFHRPAQTPEVLGRPGLFAGRLSAYAPEFFSEIGYVSDSAGYWSYGHPLDHRAVESGRSIQIVAHPYLWMHEKAKTPFERIEGFRREREAFLVEELRRNLRYYPR